MDNKQIANRWQRLGIFHFSGTTKEGSKEETFSVDTPPPTVSGTLHMGHVFSYCHCDFVARFKRMNGANVFYPIGFDDNGLPTERLVEKKCKIRGVSLFNQGKGKEFLEACVKVIEEDEEKFENLFKNLGLSFDWSRKYQTIQEGANRIAQMSFADIFLKGLAYASKSPVYWDTADQTALAQAEIEEKEAQSWASNVLFTVQLAKNEGGEEGNNACHDSNEAIGVKIMTTRPELLPSCMCLLYNPNDERYNGKEQGKKGKIQLVDGTEIEIQNLNLEGATATTPLGKTVPVTTSEDVDITKGTGLVMCCAFGDWQDVIWSQTLNIKYEQTIISDNGRIANRHYQNIENETARQKGKAEPEQTEEILNQENSRTINEAREWIIKALQEKSATIQGKQVPYITHTKAILHQVKCGERSGKPLEILEKPQWYINMGLGAGAKGQTCCYFVNTISEQFGQYRPKQHGIAFSNNGGKGDEWAIKTQIVETQYAKANHQAENNEDNPKRHPNLFQTGMLEMAEKIEILPANMRIKLTQWIENLAHDWCISRNRFSGIKVPQVGLFVPEDGTGFAILPIADQSEQCAKAYERILSIVSSGRKLININDLLKQESHRLNTTPEKLLKQLSNSSCNSANRLAELEISTTLTNTAKEVEKETGQSLSSMVELINSTNKANLVFDTWFTSSLSPQINTGTITCSPTIQDAFGTNKRQEELHKQIYPFTVRPQAHEIIRTWTFYTMAKAYLHAIEFNKETYRWEMQQPYPQTKLGKENPEGQSKTTRNQIENIMPWKTVMLSGWCLASDKTKMSKSKGNIVDPVKLIESYGPDAVRYWASTAHLGIDTPYSEGNIKEGLRLVKKLSNTVQFITPYTQNWQRPLGSEYKGLQGTCLEVIDQWIILKLNLALQEYVKHFQSYDYCRAREVAEKFFWNDLCDNYIEIIKGRIYGETSFAYQAETSHQVVLEQKTPERIRQNSISAAFGANVSIDAITAMLAPFVPFTAEAMYLTRNPEEEGKGGSIHAKGTLLRILNTVEELRKNIPENSLAEGNVAVEVVSGIRKYKAYKGISVKSPIGKIIVQHMPKGCEFDIRCVCNALSAQILVNPETSEIVAEHIETPTKG